MPANELRVELDRWAAWHWVRSGLSLVALTAAILSCLAVSGETMTPDEAVGAIDSTRS